METNYITIPFDVERAERISNGQEEGKIVTRDGKEVRIVCFNVRHNNYPIVGLIDEGDYESAESFSKNGEYSIGDGELDSLRRQRAPLRNLKRPGITWRYSFR